MGSCLECFVGSIGLCLIGSAALLMQLDCDRSLQVCRGAEQAKTVHKGNSGLSCDLVVTVQ